MLEFALLKLLNDQSFLWQQWQFGPHLHPQQQQRQSIPIPQRPAKPTNAKMMRAPIMDIPPNRLEIRSYWKKPIKPQFNEPITINNRTIKRSTFMKSSKKGKPIPPIP
jgi:hypothetical protein